MEYGLLGEKLSHSHSPLIHSYFGKYDYQLFEKNPEELEKFLLDGDFRGLNVTIPYKTAVIKYMAELSPVAKKIGSVNTIIRREDGSLYGDNTDYGGLMYAIRRSGIFVGGKKALVLGSGGASLTAQAVLRDLGAKTIVVISRSGENNYGNLHIHKDAEIIVNATPVGMYPNNGESPIDLAIFPSLKGVVDIVANPMRTALIMQAESLGIKRVGGLPMLVAQAAYASQRFTGRKIYDSDIENVIKAVSKSTKNIVLIGMPGCGKTTVGRRLAKILDREFVDLDAMVVERAGKSIPEIFEEDGEEAFRQMETDCVIEAGKKNGAVISAGGGVVTKERNYAPLSQNGTIIFIKRNIHQLATRGRPLSETKNVEVLASERLPLYKKWASVTVENMGVPQTASLIMSFLRLKKKK